MNDKIEINPEICSGKPVVKNTRVLVSNILAELATGADYNQILLNYPNISMEDILACLEFGSEILQFETIVLEQAI